MIEQTYFLDMIPGESTPPVVHVSQFDVNSRTLTFNLMKGGVAFVPDAGMSVTLDGMKPDNHVFSYPMTVNGSSVSIDVLTQMTVVSGHVRCEVSVSNQSGKIGSANFILAVEESPIDSGSISESDIPIFEDLKNQAQQAAESAEQSASDAEGFAEDAETAASSVLSIVATIERSTTASHAYSVGDYLVLNGQLYEVTTAISSGETLTVGTNISATTVGSELTALNSNLSQKVSSVNGEIPDSNGNVSLIAEDIPADGVGSKDVSGNPIIITDGVAENAQNLSVEIEPIQDLNGYDHPWAGGAGKNLLKNTITTVTNGGVTATTNEDTSVSFNGTPTKENGRFNIFATLPAGTYTASGCPSGGRNGTYLVAIYKRNGSDVSLGEDRGDGVTFTLTETSNVIYSMYFYQAHGTYNDLRFYPQIEAGSVKTSFEPYENICPITGRTQVDVLRTGKNLCPPVTIGQSYDNNTGEEITSNSQACSAKFPIDKDKTYVFTKNCDVNAMLFAWDSEGNYVGRTTGNNYSQRVITKSAFSTIGQGTGDLDSIAQIAIKFYQASGQGQNIDDVVGAEYQLYEQDTKKSVTVDLGQTVYGGTLDVTTGLLTVKTANIASYNGETIGAPWWSSMDKYVAGATPTTGAQVVYTLATPTTVSLTPAQLALLEGYNIITTDGDTLNLRYTGTVASNVQSEIDEFEESTRRLASSLAMIETSPATANHAVGSYLMLNNRLCKATSAIATGEQIIVGSNVQYTTVAEELAAILAQINA